MFTLKRRGVIVFGIVAGLVLALLLAILVLLTVLVYRGVSASEPAVREVVVTRVVDVTPVPAAGPTVAEAKPGPALNVFLEGSPFDQPAVVQAVAAGVPWHSLAGDLVGPEATITIWYFAPAVSEPTTLDPALVAFDEERAIALIAETGLTEPIQFAVLAPDDDPALNEMSQIVAEMVAGLFDASGAPILAPTVGSEAGAGSPLIRLSR
jgi:ABC-type transport system substrate-binding protein